MISITKEDIIEELDQLPPESLSELQAFIQFLRFKSEKKSPQPIRLGGLWKDLPPLTEEDIAQARREMWLSTLTATFGMWADRSDVEKNSVEYVQNIRRGHRLNDFIDQADETD